MSVDPPDPSPAHDRAPTDGVRPGGSAWIGFILLTGATLYSLRVASILLANRVEPAPPLPLVRWYVLETLPRMLLVAFAAATIGTLLARWLARRSPIATPFAALVFFAATAGWPVDDPVFRLDPAAPGGMPLALGVSTACLILALVLVVLGRRERGQPATRPRSAFPLALAIGAVAAVGAPASVCLRYGRHPPSHRAGEVVREILAEPGAWTVVSSDPDRPPHVGTITPTLDWSLDGGDLPSLLMPPPCEVRFEVREEDGPVTLHASAGVDAAMEGMLLRAPKDCAVLFEIAVNGQRRFGARVETRATDVGRVWRHAGGRAGLPLVPGDIVTLKTSLEPEEFDATTRQEIPVGFGRLELEREIARPFERASAERPSILFIVMDTLRADELSCYGNAAHETPALDALAARGLLHERAYATSSWTWPSTASMLTGLWPETHGVVSHAACYLDGSFDTLAEVLGRTNATTAAFLCNPLIDPTKGFSQGFETYDYSRDFRTSGAVVDDVRAWIARHAGTRFFLYLHWIDPHRPIKARREDFARLGVSPSPPPGSPAEALIEAGRILREGQAVVEGGRSDPDRVLSAEEQRWIRDAYSASVLSADHYVGEVLRELEERGLADTTLVVFTSDHGEELFDHGLFGHGQSLHQELVRVPLILAGPGVPRGVRSSAPVTNLALFETLATRGGARERRADALDGSTVDLGAPVRGGPSTQYFSTETGWWWNRHQSVQYAVQEWPWVLVVAPEALPWGAPEDADPGDGQIRLFDLARDPGERVDRSAAEPEVVRALRQRWSEHLEAQAAIGAGSGRSAGPGTLDLLRRFGYTGDDK